MGGKSKHRVYPREESTKERALRKKIKEQEAEIKRLKSELSTLNKAFSKTASFIKGNLDNVNVEKVIQGVREERTMVEIKENNICPDCGSEIRSSKLPFGSMDICISACGWRSVNHE